MRARFEKVVTINRTRIGAGCPCYIVADVGSNHNADLKTAKRYIEAARDIGLSAIKFQSFEVERYLARRIRVGGRYRANPAYERTRQYQLPYKWHGELFAHARRLGVTMFTTIDDMETIDFLETLRVPAYKISSQDLVFLPLIARAAATGKPIIFSTGIGDVPKVREAVQTIVRAGSRQAVMLHCVTTYPSRFAEMNIRCVRTLGEEFGLPVGLSDHTPAYEDPYSIALGAVALGACMIEKHITFDRRQSGPDHHFAMEVDEFANLVKYVRHLEQGLGDGRKLPRPREKARAIKVTKSLHAARDIKAGQVLGQDDVQVLRPGYGIAPKYLSAVVGMRARRDIQAWHALTWDVLEHGHGHKRR